MPLIDKDQFTHSHTTCAHCHSAANSSAFGGPEAEKHYPPDLGIESEHIEIAIKLNLPQHAADLEITHKLRANRDGVTTIHLDGIDFINLSVSDNHGAELQHTYDGEKISVTWATPWANGDVHYLRLCYSIEKPASGLIFSTPDSAHPNRPVYAATDHETERARHWLACVDLPNIRTSLTFRITAPDHLTILANGILQAENKNADQTKTAVWSLQQRCPSYLICFAVGDFIRYDDSPVDGIPVAYFATRDLNTEDLHRSFGKTPTMINWIIKKLGVSFPFPKYYQFALPHFGGAMENISLVSWSDDIIVGPNDGADRQWICDQTNVHELAHSYFGDLVVCRDFAHAWLKESWATYMETCWLEDMVSHDEMHYDLYRNAQAYIDEADTRYSRPLVTRSFTTSWQMYDRHLYPGGACRLHTLRRELGDAVFWSAVTDYIQNHREQVVETVDFQRSMERHSGRSLQKFFDQWITTASYPHLKVSFSYDASKKIGTFEVEQKQYDKKNDIPIFELTTDVAWTNSAGQTEVRTIYLDKIRQSFVFAMPEDPVQVRFDPTWRILHKLDFNPGDTRLKNQLIEAKDVIGRIHAASELCKTGKRSNIKAVASALINEPFWGVRREMIKALTKTRTDDALNALIDLVSLEKNSHVLPLLFLSAANFREPKVLKTLLNRLERGDLDSHAQANLIIALSQLRQLAPVEVIKQHSEIFDKPHGTIQAAALQGLGNLRDEDLATYIIDQTEFGKLSYRVRSRSAHALGAIGYFATNKKARSEIQEHLIDLLRDPQRVMQDAAAAALSRAGFSDSRSALLAYRNTLPHQDRPLIDNYVRGLAQFEEDKVKSLESQLDELNATIRKLSDRVQDLEDKT